MNTIVVSSTDRGTFLKVNKTTAEKVFNANADIYVTTSDRNPVNYLTEAHHYKKGCEPRWVADIQSVDTFQQALQDFAQWLDEDGYGHIPNHHKAEKQLFSYWVEIG
jgi:hypothetical protein